MKAISSVRSRSMNLGALVVVSDNSGGKIGRVTSVVRGKTVKGRQQSAGLGDHVKISIRAGVPEMAGQVFDAVVIRQKKEFRRKTGERIAFEDNAVAILKDDKGNPKGTQIKGPIAREITERWPLLSKIASIIV
jgi:large subunit ribosomal protein L14